MKLILSYNLISFIKIIKAQQQITYVVCVRQHILKNDEL